MELTGSIEAERREKRLQLLAERLRGLLAHEIAGSGLPLVDRRYIARVSRARPLRHYER
jgi:hypothetical protein